MTISKLNELVADLKEDARNVLEGRIMTDDIFEAKRACRGMVIRSRGIEIGGFYANGDRTDYTFNVDRITKKRIDSFLEANPTVTALYASGGWDAHRTVEWDDDYEPYVSEWGCTIWTPETGVTFKDPFEDEDDFEVV